MPATSDPLPDPTLGTGEGLALNGVHAAGEVLAGLGAVVVTGVCGFIGSHVALALLRRGATVIGVDRRPLEMVERTAGLLRLLHDQRGFRLLTVSVDDPALARCLGGASAVVHLAAATDVAASWGAGFAEHAASVLSTQRLLEACSREGVPRVVVASSSHVYGPVGGGLAREDLLVEPTSPYGVAKLAAEGLAVAYARRPGSRMSVVALRLFTAFGPGCHPAMVVPRIRPCQTHRHPHHDPRPAPAAQLQATLAAYNTVLTNDPTHLRPVPWADLMTWAKIHHILTSPYLGRGGYRHHWTGEPK